MNKTPWYINLGLTAAFASIWLAGCRAVSPTPQHPATPIQPTKTSPPPTETIPPEPTATQLPPTAMLQPTTIAPYEVIPELINDGWETGSLVSADINPVIIRDMVDHIYRGEYSTDSFFHEDGSTKYEGIHSIVIVKDGKLVFEEYFNLNDRDFTHDTHSVTKSVTSLLVGLAIEHGFLQSTDEHAFPYLSDYMPIANWDENKASITLEDLLTMSSGMECDDSDPNSKGEQWKMYVTDDWLDFFLSLPSARPPGRTFAYCSGGVIALGGVLERATGMSISDFSEQFLFDPMGIHDFSWLELPWGTSTSGALWLRPRDMAKLGQMMLDNGKWRGQQIVPETWVQASRANQIELGFKSREWFNEYGYLWWRGNLEIKGTIYHPYAAWGLGGQMILIFPKENMVVVFTTGNEQGDGSLPFRITEKYILPAIQKGAP